MRTRPRVYKTWYGSLPWIVRVSSIDVYQFPSWDEAMHFVRWYTAEPTA